MILALELPLQRLNSASASIWRPLPSPSTASTNQLLQSERTRTVHPAELDACAASVSVEGNNIRRRAVRASKGWSSELEGETVEMEYSHLSPSGMGMHIASLEFSILCSNDSRFLGCRFVDAFGNSEVGISWRAAHLRHALQIVFLS
jgi:hypothetical protein